MAAEEIADAAVGAAKACAAIVHLHARDFVDGRPDQSPDALAPFLSSVKSHLYNLHYFWQEGWVKAPLFIQTVFGLLGGKGRQAESNVEQVRQERHIVEGLGLVVALPFILTHAANEDQPRALPKSLTVARAPTSRIFSDADVECHSQRRQYPGAPFICHEIFSDTDDSA